MTVKFDIAEEHYRKALETPRKYGPRSPITLVHLVRVLYGFKSTSALARHLGFNYGSSAFGWMKKRGWYTPALESQLLTMIRKKLPHSAATGDKPAPARKSERTGEQTLTITVTDRRAMNAVRALAYWLAHEYPDNVTVREPQE